MKWKRAALTGCEQRKIKASCLFGDNVDLIGRRGVKQKAGDVTCMAFNSHQIGRGFKSRHLRLNFQSDFLKAKVYLKVLMLKPCYFPHKKIVWKTIISKQIGNRFAKREHEPHFIFCVPD